MNRRQLLKHCVGGVAIATMTRHMSADASEENIGYTRELYEQLLASGQPFLLDFAAKW